MNNKKMLEIILQIREIRNNLVNLNLNKEEKEVLRRSLNYYEDLLNLDITRNNLTHEELEDENIENDIEVVKVPTEENSNRYQEFSNLKEDELISLINKINESLNNLEIDINDKKVILNSLKEYCLYKEQISLMKKSNREVYDEVMDKSL